MPAETRGHWPRIFSHLLLNGVSQHHPLIKPEEREFVVDSATSMHMLSRKDLNSAELEPVRVSKSPTTVVAANGEVQTKEEATVYVKEFDFIRDGKASRRYIGPSPTRKSLRRSRIFLPETENDGEKKYRSETSTAKL